MTHGAVGSSHGRRHEEPNEKNGTKEKTTTRTISHSLSIFSIAIAFVLISMSELIILKRRGVHSGEA